MRGIIQKLGGLLILGALIYFVYPFVVGAEKMEAYCNTISLGDELADAVLSAADEGYEVMMTPAENRISVIDRRAFGRFLCDIDIQDGFVAGTKFVIND